VDVTSLTALFSETFQPSWYVLMARIAAAALAEHPLMNAAWRDGVVLNEGIHIGIAVDTDDGVIVPVIRDIAAKPIQDLAEESKRLVEAARAGKLTLDQLQGGTFTLTNLGMYDIDAFTPIIHLPQCAILGLGRVTPKVVVLDEESGSTDIRRMMSLSLTFDHRVVDGAPAARFLRRIKQLVEEPDEVFKSDNR
jgi:pyruvate dehydrogenase E2 component (dihydrolipoamide acetyltransferase)